MSQSSLSIASTDLGDFHPDDLLKVQASDISTFVDDGVVFEGKIKVTSGRALLITGTVIGAIESNGAVLINGGEVKGSIKAASLQVAGKITRLSDKDQLDIDGAMVLAPNADVDCDAVHGGIKAEFGARFSGNFQPRQQVVTELLRPETSASVSFLSEAARGAVNN